MFAGRELGLFGLLVLLFLFAWRVEPAFVSLRAQSYLVPHVWELAIVALPMLLIVISSGIDLSVGSMVALSAVSFGLMYERGQPLGVCAGLAIAIGTLAGYLNGLAVAKLKVHPLIVTLATLAAYRGIAEGLSLARPLSGYPEGFLKMWSGWTPAILFTVLAAAVAVLLTTGTLGRRTIAIGTNEVASRFSGLPVDRTKTSLYAFSGLCCGLAAIILVARNNTAKADLATGMELDVITAVVLGGAKIEGGEGSILGLLLGVILIHETREFVSWHWKQNELNLIVIGSLLIASVLLQKLLQSRKRVVSKATA